jgi:hypothetical protein
MNKCSFLITEKNMAINWIQIIWSFFVDKLPEEIIFQYSY